ncbi:hypothetical protein Tco_0905245 [Tanacetum coccineum]
MSMFMKDTMRVSRKILVKLYVFVVIGGVIRWRCLSYVGVDQFRIRLENNTQQSLKFIFVAMEAGASSLNLRIMNQEFVKLDKFDGPLLAPIPANHVASEGQEVDPNKVLKLEKQRMIRKEDETLCCGHIKNSLSDRLYDV